MKVEGGAANPQDVLLEAHPELIGDSVSIHLAQEAGSAAVWTLHVDVHIPQGWFRLGRIVTRAPSLGDPPARTVGFGVCPGAMGWKVIASCSTAEIADVVLQSSRCCGAVALGVTANVFP